MPKIKFLQGMGVCSLITFFLVITSFALSMFFGYWYNVYNLVTKSDFDAPYKEEIIRGLGVPLAPMGAVVGILEYFDVVDLNEIDLKGEATETSE